MGFVMAKLIPKIKEHIIVNNDKEWRVKFNCYFVIHENGEKTNSVIKTPSVEIFVKAKTESDASDLVLEMLETELRIEIENIELWLLPKD